MSTYQWTQRCSLTGETNVVDLTEDEKRQIEMQAAFCGWGPGELVEVDADE